MLMCRMRIRTGVLQMNTLRYQRWLVDEKSQIERQITQLYEEHAEASLKEATSELSSYDQHPADLASELTERDLDFAVKEQKRIRLGEVEDALARIASGAFGTCARCGQKVGEERLEANPAAKYCIGCEERVEAQAVERVRPVEEEVISFHDFGGLVEELDETD